jgi:hypothetical protein
MKTTDILQLALDRLRNQSHEEVESISRIKGLDPDTMRSFPSDRYDFVFDLGGLFPEVVNSKVSWFPRERLKKKSSVTINGNEKSHIKVALSF